MIRRALLLCVAIAAAGLFAARLSGAERPVVRTPLEDLPRTLGAWHMVRDAPLEDGVLNVLGVDDYANREYVGPHDAAVSLYIGYYASQRQGDTIHSPQNCLPGAGWLPVESARTTMTVAGRTVPVNRYVIQKGLDRQVVYYWYQGRHRIVANEYLNKMWLMVDAARLHRTNGSLVRVISPVGESVAQAERTASGFAGILLPHLSAYLP